MTTKRLAATCTVVLITLAWLVPPGSAGATGPTFCGPDDKPEPALQGQTPLSDMASGRSQDPYFCGLRIVGHSDIWNRGANWQLARSQHCAYVSSMKAVFVLDPEDPVTTREPAGVAVIDASNPGNPEPVGLLRGPGSLDSVETMDAADSGKRHVLVAGDYSGGFGPGGGPAALDIYDVSDCAKPEHMATYYWPANAHNVTLSPDGKRVYGTRADYGVMVLDITRMREPKLVANARLTLPDGTVPGCHTVEFNRAETRMYCAGSVSSAAKVDPPQARDDGPSIWDVSDFKRRVKDPKVRYVGEADIAGQGAHHAVLATINNKPYVVAADELAAGPTAFDDRAGCASAAYPRIFDVSDEHRPRLVGQFRLEVQDHCGDPGVEVENANGQYASHYNSVDDPWGDTRMGLFGMVGAGLRVVDLRDPTQPREVAYYKPGANPNTTLQPVGIHVSIAYHNPHVTDACGSRNVFDKKTGHFWFVCQSSGFHIAELSPEVRRYMGLRAAPPA